MLLEPLSIKWKLLAFSPFEFSSCFLSFDTVTMLKQKRAIIFFTISIFNGFFVLVSICHRYEYVACFIYILSNFH